MTFCKGSIDGGFITARLPILPHLSRYPHTALGNRTVAAVHLIIRTHVAIVFTSPTAPT
jgi:hypothetical protein